jgi:ribokinase
MVDLVTTGGIILDNVVTADGAVHLDGLGGNAVYSAAGARLWSRRVACVGLVPRNYPDSALAPLAAAGVDLSGVRRVEAEVAAPEWFFHRPDGSRVDGLHAPSDALRAFGLPDARIDPADARRFEAHLRAGGGSEGGFGSFRAAHPVEPESVPEAFWTAASGLHCAPNRLDAQHRLLARARAAGLAVSLDPGRQARDMTPADLDAFLDECDIFLPSEAEIRVLVPGEEPLAALRRLARRGGAVIAGKLGAAGSVVIAPGDEPVAIPSLPVPAPDPTGAGDAYAGGFLAGFLATRDPVLAACCATVSASFAVEGFGPNRLLAATAREARERLGDVVARIPRAQAAPELDILMETDA